MGATNVFRTSIDKFNSIDQVVQLDTQPITMNIYNHNLMQGISVINKIVENYPC
jgi:hypothetical protein